MILGLAIIKVGVMKKNNLGIEILVFSSLMIACALFLPRALAIAGPIMYILIFRKIALLPKPTVWKDGVILLAILTTGTLATIGIWGICRLAPSSNSCTFNSIRGHIFSFFVFPLIPYLVFFIVMSLPQYLKMLLRRR